MNIKQKQKPAVYGAGSGTIGVTFATPPRELTGRKSSLTEPKSIYLQRLREMIQPKRMGDCVSLEMASWLR